MNEILEFMVRHGAAVLFAAVFVEQIGVPLPAAPWLLAAGALAATGKTNWFVAVIAALASLGSGALGVVVGLAALYIGYKYYQRQRLLKELRMARITADELHQKLESGESPIILDLRSHAELERDPSLIRGARHMTMEEVKLWQHEIPRDRDIILYCSCPNEVSSARTALLLHRNGIRRVRPLLGGIDAWRERTYPTEPRLVRVASLPGAGQASGERNLFN